MLKITVEGNKEEVERANSRLRTICFMGNYCKTNCTECEKGKVEVKYIVKEDK